MAFSVPQVLTVVAEFGSASRALVAWELCVPTREVASAWRRAVAEGLLEERGTDSISGELMFTLSEAGRARLGAPPEPATQPEPATSVGD